MDDEDLEHDNLPSAREDAHHAEHVPPTPQTRSASYRLAFADPEFLLREELRPVRLQLELLKPELELQARRIESTIVVFGSARIPEPEQAQVDLEHAVAAAAAGPDDPALAERVRAAERVLRRSRYYEEARRFARIVSLAGQAQGAKQYVVVTGGGPGIMAAANRGAHEVGALSIGHNITLPHEQAPNVWTTPELSFQFHYFALRKMHFMMRARALVVFPGGYGTLDELFETLCLIQTGKSSPMPVLLFDQAYWRRIIDFQALVEEGMIGPGDADLFSYVETAEEAWELIRAHYELPPGDPC
ncbi:MAG TPA: TIGR00730 family Rossman fold protein [Geminicoccaceae bacterium]|nr:TIGR00730 family Rossman fold protein [Geminicoccaceae bacterium]